MGFWSLFKKNSIGKKLAKSYIVIILITIIISQFTTLRETKFIIDNQAQTHLNQTRDNLVHQLSIVTDEIDRYASALLLNGKLISFLTNYNSKDHQTTFMPVDVSEALKNILRQRLDISNIYIYTKDKDVFVEGVDIKLPPEYSIDTDVRYNTFISSNKDYMFIPPNMHKGYYSYEVFSFMRKIKSIYSPNELGVLRIDIRVGVLDRLCFQGENHEAITTIYDESGREVFHSRWYDNNGLGPADIECIGNKLAGTNGTFNFQSKQNTKYMVSFALEKNSKWYITLTIPVNLLYYNSTYIIQLSLIFLFAGTIIAIFLTLMISVPIVKSITKLLKGLKSIENGDFECKIYIDTKDELATLGNGFNSMASKIKELIDVNTQIQVEKRTAELSVLKSQLNPHFLYNTLDMIRMKALINNDPEIHDLILQFATLLRESVKGREDFVTLGYELDYVSRYIALQNTGKNIKFEIHANEQVKNIPVPKFILQPIVENTFVHGFFDSVNEKQIVIDAEENKDFLKITIKDNGVGISEERLKQIRASLREESDDKIGIGIKNVHRRLVLLCGEQSGLEITSVPHEGTTVTISISLKSVIYSKNNSLENKRQNIWKIFGNSSEF